MIFNAPAEGVPLGIGYQRWGQKKLECQLPAGGIGFKIGFAVLIQFRRVTQSHVAVASTRYAYLGCAVKMALLFCTQAISRDSSRVRTHRKNVKNLAYVVMFHREALQKLCQVFGGKWVPAAAGKAKAGMAHSHCGWTCGCACKTVKSLENTCHTWALLRWWFTTKRRYMKCMHLTFTFFVGHATSPLLRSEVKWSATLFIMILPITSNFGFSIQHDLDVCCCFCTGVCGQGLSYVFAAPPIKYLVIFLRLSIANPNPNPNLKP